MLTPNIGFYDSHVSSWCLVSGSFSAVNKHLKEADKACIKFQERETSPDFFFIGMEGLEGHDQESDYAGKFL